MDTTNLKTRMNTKVQALSEREPGTSQYLALNSNALELIQENLKHQPLSFHLFDMVKSPSGGSTVFSVPGLSGEEAEKELTGIILDYTTPRAYWATSDPVEGMPPTCLSKDSLISRTGKPAPTALSMILAARMGSPRRKPARSPCCCSCCVPAVCSPSWSGCR